VNQQGLFTTIGSIWGPLFFGSATAWKILFSYSAFQLLLMRIVPGKPFYGPITPKGNIPVYKANGTACFLITIFSFLTASCVFHWFSPAILYDNLGPLLGALNSFSLVFCLFLYFKGIFAPSSSDHGVSGNPIFDYYWGTELYPTILGWNVKQFTNCRFGMMGWPILLLSYAAKQYELFGYISDSMLVAVALQFIYVGKFFLWEGGYLRSLDIMHDRAGFMICWGCLVWVPCIYTSSTLYLVQHPNHLGWFVASAIFLAGAASIIINYLADRQRQLVRAKEGQCLVWGRVPHLIQASYKTQDGKTNQSLLLASGWWGISRHFHYIPELAGTFFWTLPCLFSNFSPYFYFCFLTILLLDRAFRHDRRCADKYGEFWDQYCKKVPYKIIPYVF
jgi:7-dehydrocholesterol reductase